MVRTISDPALVFKARKRNDVSFKIEYQDQTGTPYDLAAKKDKCLFLEKIYDDITQLHEYPEDELYHRGNKVIS